MKFIEKLTEARQKNKSLLCVGLDTDPGLIPDKVGVLEFNKAIAENDIDTLYAITAPAITGDRIPFEQFKDIYVPRFRSRGSEAELARDCGCQTLARTRTDQLFIRCVFVITIPFDKRRASILEMWEYINGEWYWGFTDYHETQGRCPSGS